MEKKKKNGREDKGFVVVVTSLLAVATVVRWCGDVGLFGYKSK